MPVTDCEPEDKKSDISRNFLTVLLAELCLGPVAELDQRLALEERIHGRIFTHRLNEFNPVISINKKLYIYLALGLSQGEMHLDEGEFLTVEKVHINEAVSAVMNNEITDAKTIIGILKAKEYLNSHK